MALKIKFEQYGDDIVYNPQPPTFVLMTRSGKKFGVVHPVDEKVRCYLNSADEMSFQVYKEIDGGYVFHEEPTVPYYVGDRYEYDKNDIAVVGLAITGRAIVGKRPFKYICINSRESGSFHSEDWVEASTVPEDVWDNITNFKLLWCKEWNQIFEIYVDVDDGDGVSKFVTGKALGEAELGQIMLFDIQINTEDDIARDDYKPTVFFDPFDPEDSLLHRITEKAPHYTFGHIDASLMNIQRTFEFSDKSLYDAFQEISEEIDCLFKLDCYLDEDMNIVREINVYDMESTCNDCGHRGEFWDVCPECGSTDVTNGYGEDTGIFFSVDNLTDDVRYSTDTGAVKNCFKLVAGDDVMTAAVRAVNPSGSDYIYYMSDEMKADMSEELVAKLNEYDTLYDYYYKDYEFGTTGFNTEYNELVDKYNTAYQTDYQEIDDILVGYPSISEAYYYAEDFYYYLHDALLPTVEMSDTSASIEAAKLTAQAVSPVAVSNLSVASQSTVENAVLGMAKVIVDARYKTTIHTDSYANYVWRGYFTVENYSDDEDVADSLRINVTITGDYETYVKQKIDKALERRMIQTDAPTDIVQLFKLSLERFTEELEKYSLSGLNGLYESCQTVIDVLIEQGIANHTSWAGEDRDLYEILYIPYRQKLEAIETETSVRSSEIDIVNSTKDIVFDKMREIQTDLNLEEFIGEELWLEFSSFRREDEYQNGNYISDGLSNAEIIDKAIEFVEVAKRDIVKSATLQHSISSTLANLLVMEDFQPIVDHFENGNWIRCRVADDVFRLRLMDYELDYSNIEKLSVSFSDVMRHISGITDLAQVVKQAQSMATSYGHVTRQAEQGGKANNTMHGWVHEGLSLTTMKIVNEADRQTIAWDDRGLLARRYDDITETYDEKQLKIINNGLYVTDDDWATSKAGIGEFTFYNPMTQQTETQYGVIADYLVGYYVLGENAGIFSDDTSILLNKDGISVTSDKGTVTINPNAVYLFDIKKGNNHLLYLDEDGVMNVNGTIVSNNATITGGNINMNTASDASDLIKLNYDVYTASMKPLGFRSIKRLTGKEAYSQVEQGHFSVGETYNNADHNRLFAGLANGYSGTALFSINDVNDTRRMYLGMSGAAATDYPHLSFYDSSGVARSVLSGGSSGNPHLSLYNSSGTRLAVFALNTSGRPSMAFLDSSGKNRFGIELDSSQRPFMAIRDGSEVTRAAIGINSSGYPQFTLLNSSGTQVAAIAQTAASTASMSITGNVSVGGRLAIGGVYVDYITSYANTNGWYVRTWYSGLVECWRVQSWTNLSVTTAWGYVYEAILSNSAKAFPVTFSSVPYLQTSIAASGGGCWLENTGSVTTVDTPSLYVCSATQKTGFSVTVHWYAFGKKA